MATECPADPPRSVDANNDSGCRDDTEWPRLTNNKATKQFATPLPKLQLSLLLYLQLAEPVTATVILPFIVQLTEETGITGGDVTKVGYYAGLVESLFFATEALMILQWGRLSDRIGRRPVLLTGVFGLGLSMLCFGLSHTFWYLVASRALAGALNGNAGVIKCMLGEITDESNIARAASFTPVVWAAGATMGPLIGGFLQHPAERFGGAFGNSEFWTRNPYFLPCLVAALYSASTFVLIYFFMSETAPAVTARNHVQDQATKTNSNHNNSLCRDPIDECTPLISAGKLAQISLRNLLTKRVIIVIVAYGLLAMTDIAFSVLQPVFLSTPIQNGGLGMSPSLIGFCLAIIGLADGVVATIFFPPLDQRFGTRNVMAVCALAHVGSYSLFPVMNAIARVDGKLGPLVWVLLAIQTWLVTLPTMAFIGVFIFLTAAPSSRAALGATTGLAQTTTSIMRAIGPAGATSLFALSVERNLLGGTFVYIVMCTIAALTAASSMLLPARPWPRAEH